MTEEVQDDRTVLLPAVSEIFGPTIQGEGPNMGRPVTFLRLALCNQACTWCDTPYTWDWSRFEKDREIHRMSLDAIRWKLLSCGLRETGRLVVSGGEPLIQQVGLYSVLEMLPEQVEVETAGTLAPIEALARRVDQWNVSPKLAHSGNRLETRYKPEVLRTFAGLPSVFKFVVDGPEDFEEVRKIQAEVGLTSDRIWIMPQGVHYADLRDRARLIVDEVIRRGYNLSWRLQVELWGTERGH